MAINQVREYLRAYHEEAILVVAAGDARIDNHKFKETFHT